MLSLLCGLCGGRSDSVPSQETPWLCYCHHYGHSSPLKLIQADQQPALLASTGTAGLFGLTEPVTCPSKAWMFRLHWDINQTPLCMKRSLDYRFDSVKWNNSTKVTFTKQGLV